MSPDYVGVELGVGESLLIKAIGESTGRSAALVKADLKKEGDLGLVAMVIPFIVATLFNSHYAWQNSKSSQKTLFKPKPLTIPFVFSNLRDIALSTGHSVCGLNFLAVHSVFNVSEQVSSKESLHHHKTFSHMSRLRS